MPTAPFPTFEIQPIIGTECIGDSRSKIVTNFNNLSASANFACMKVVELSTTWTSYAKYLPDPNNGYISLASGIVFQWGTVSGLADNQQVRVNFPKPMSQVFSITTTHVITERNLDQTAAACSIAQGYDGTGFSLIQDTVGNHAVSEMWMAIGAGLL